MFKIEVVNINVVKNFPMHTKRKCQKCEAPSIIRGPLFSGNSFTETCSTCNYKQEIPLPSLCKKLIYLDQFVISNITKAVNPKSMAKQRGIDLSLWENMFRRLHKLVHDQLIICPSSCHHKIESATNKIWEDSERVLNTLSAEISFHGYLQIQQKQIWDAFDCFIKEQPFNIKTDPEFVLYGDPNKWTGDLEILIPSKFSDEWIEDIEDHKEQVSGRFSKLFIRWKSEQKSFDDTYKEELQSIGPAILKEGFDEWLRWMRLHAGDETVAQETDFLGPNEHYETIMAIIRELMDDGYEQRNAWRKASEFFKSDYISELPGHKISALFYASLAEQARNGQKTVKSSFETDVMAVSSLAPYCDAIFVDNAVYDIMKKPQFKNKADLATRVFSLQCINEWNEYLDEIDQSASKMHRFFHSIVYPPYKDPLPWYGERFVK